MREREREEGECAGERRLVGENQSLLSERLAFACEEEIQYIYLGNPAVLVAVA